MAATMAGRASRVHPFLMRSLPFFISRKKQGIRFISVSKSMYEPLSTSLISSASESETSIPGTKVLEIFKEEFEIGSLLITLETGKIARFANGSVVISIGDTKVLSTVTCSKDDSPRDFLPLTVDYQEKQFAQGVIPNTFMRREGAPKERELLCGRIIDRPIRPLFPPGFFHEVQVMASVLSSDGKQDPDVMAVNASSVALMLSDIPWRGPIGVVRIGRICGEFIVNPSVDELSLSDLNLLYACTRDKTLMMDVQAREISERELEAALRLAHPEAVKYLDPQISLADKIRKKKKEYKLSMVTQTTLEKVRNLAETSIEKVFTDPSYGKFERGEALENITENTRRSLEEECDEESLKVLSKAVDTVRKMVVRKRIFKEGIRVDGRKVDEVRPLYCEAGNLPLLHGSSLFSRGDTQVLCTVTLGSPLDAQRLVSVVGPTTKRFMLHYSFPPFSINEVGKRIGLNRREVGHGTLAEKSLLAVLPPEDELLYTVRVNSEVMASDGSTSMASVCGASMALMDAGIPLRESVAGISVGLVSDIDPVTGVFKDYRILTDILGLEDHLGDMDFKVSGTRQGITAIQLDIKPAGIPLDIILEALEPARKGRIQIIDRMEQEINSHRIQKDRNLPQIVTLKINSDSLRRVIGPMGTVKKQLEDETGARILISNGSLTVVAKNSSMMETVQEKIESMIGREIEVGGIYKGVVTSVKEYGAFVEFNGGKQEGLLHISELSHDTVTRVSDVVSVGQQLSLMCIGLDVRGNIKLSLKATLPRPVASVEERHPVHTLKEPTPLAEKVTSLTTDARCPLPKSSVPSVVIRSTAECDEAEKLLGFVKTRRGSRTPEGTGSQAGTGGDILQVSTTADAISMNVTKKPRPSKQPLAQKEGENRTHDFTLGAGKSNSPKRQRPVKQMGTKSTGGNILPAPITTSNSENPKRYLPVRSKGRKIQGQRIRTEPQNGRMTSGGILMAPGTEDAARKKEKASETNEKPLRVGTCVKATVCQIRPRGLVLNLGRGLQGIFRFEGDERAKFEMGRTIQVVCTGYSEKGVPVMKLV